MSQWPRMIIPASQGREKIRVHNGWKQPVYTHNDNSKVSIYIFLYVYTTALSTIVSPFEIITTEIANNRHP